MTFDERVVLHPGVHTRATKGSSVAEPPSLGEHTISEQLLHINVQRLRGGLVFKAHRLCASLNSRLESNKPEEEKASISARTTCMSLRIACRRVLWAISKFALVIHLWVICETPMKSAENGNLSWSFKLRRNWMRAKARRNAPLSYCKLPLNLLIQTFRIWTG